MKKQEYDICIGTVDVLSEDGKSTSQPPKRKIRISEEQFDIIKMFANIDKGYELNDIYKINDCEFAVIPVIGMTEQISATQKMWVDEQMGNIIFSSIDHKLHSSVNPRWKSTIDLGPNVDRIIDEAHSKVEKENTMTDEELKKLERLKKQCPSCGGTVWTKSNFHDKIYCDHCGPEKTNKQNIEEELFDSISKKIQVGFLNIDKRTEELEKKHISEMAQYVGLAPSDKLDVNDLIYENKGFLRLVLTFHSNGCLRFKASINDEERSVTISKKEAVKLLTIMLDKYGE